MRAAAFGLLAALAVVVGSAAVVSQPPDGGKGGRKGPPGKEKGPPRRFELGKVLPPFAREQLDLTGDQERQIADLEKEVKSRLERILTADQKKKLETLRPPGPPGDPPRGGPPGPQSDKPDRQDREKARACGIHWFATWEDSKAEAARTGKPILLVSAAPHCAGVSGIW
jgi:hypothetical protein